MRDKDRNTACARLAQKRLKASTHALAQASGLALVDVSLVVRLIAWACLYLEKALQIRNSLMQVSVSPPRNIRGSCPAGGFAAMRGVGGNAMTMSS